jgi:nucleoside-diphosphate-sugar epimerase
MNVFVLGATGFIGSVVAETLQRAGHRVVGLARSAASASALEARGIQPVRGSLESTRVLADAARAADAVVQAAFAQEGHDFVTSVAVERTAVRALLRALEGSGKALVVTSGTAVLGDTGHRVFDEDTPIVHPPLDAAPDAGKGALRALGERLAMEQEVLGASGVRGIVLRPPNVYGRSEGQSLLAMLRRAGRALGAVPYATGTADHRWSFVQVEDLARLYLLALEGAQGGELFHAGAERGLRTRALAEAVSQGLGLGGRTVELELPALGEALGVPPLAHYWASNSQSSGEKARRVLGWRPEHTRMLEEIAQRSGV